MLIDVSMPITAGSVFRRGTPPVEIASRRFYHESEGEYESIVLSLSAHTATHVDLVFAENRIEPERMIGTGKLLDVTQVSGGEIRLDDIEHQVEVESGDFVFFRTDWSRFVGTDEYYNHPELSLEVVQWLVSKRINAVGIDALGLGRDRKHGEYDRLLIKNDVFVIENLANLSAIPGREFKVYCFPLKIENVDAIPARVVVEINMNRREDYGTQVQADGTH
jgi:kynurenine formamidase